MKAMKTYRRFIAPLAAIALASLTACSIPVEAKYDERPADEPAASTETAPAAPEPADDCLDITEGAQSKLAGKIAETIPGAEVSRVGLVASDDPGMWMLAAEFTDPGLDRSFTGIWGSMQDLTTDSDPAFVAVDDIAAASAEYLQPQDFTGGVGAQLPSAEAAVDCLA